MFGFDYNGNLNWPNSFKLDYGFLSGENFYLPQFDSSVFGNQYQMRFNSNFQAAPIFQKFDLSNRSRIDNKEIINKENMCRQSQNYDTTFKKALNFLYEAEGGYTNNKNDHGGATNLGITQSEYNEFLSKNKLPHKDVRCITKSEATKIFHDEYWITSGANKEKDPKKAIALFDTAVLHGPGKAKALYKQSNGDLNKFLAVRKASYDSIVARDGTQKVFYKGWNNRVANLKTYLQAVA